MPEVGGPEVGGLRFLRRSGGPEVGGLRFLRRSGGLEVGGLRFLRRPGGRRVSKFSGGPEVGGPTKCPSMVPVRHSSVSRDKDKLYTWFYNSFKFCLESLSLLAFASFRTLKTFSFGSPYSAAFLLGILQCFEFSQTSK